jgi:ribulose-phosphate 3-epimerase
MALICPTITADDPHEYRTQMERVQGFAERIHIDVADGHFTPNELIDIDRVWWPEAKIADLHVMYEKPFEYAELYISLHPHMVIVHAEARGAFVPFARQLHDYGIKVGLAVLPETPIDFIGEALQLVDHVLIFSGNIGHFGGTADLMLLRKVAELKALNRMIEIGWDGGINEANVKKLVTGGVDVLNVGGFIHKAADPLEAYQKLTHNL